MKKIKTKSWQGNEYIKKILLNRKIVGVRYLDKNEVAGLSWNKSAVVLVLDNGVRIYPMSDNEGNDAGALAATFGFQLKTIPTKFKMEVWKNGDNISLLR